ncbi:hypothetical protein BDD12DRAFT_795277 [Trichophaea hybrida]|nr:hypothetical protein BDD12DRAFT_795277 [Trichophaea hybrida]
MTMFTSSFKSEGDESIPLTTIALEILRAREHYRYYQPPSSFSPSPEDRKSGQHLEPPTQGPLSPTDRVLGSITLLTSKLLSTKRALVCFADDVQVYLVADSAQAETWLTAHALSNANADGERNWKLCVGKTGLFETTLDLAERNGELEKLLEVNDLWECEKFCNDQLVSFWPSARYYAGIPLSTLNGIAIGALCVLDDNPRVQKEGMGDVDKTTLKKMGSAVMDYLEIVREERDTKRAQEMELSLSRFIAGSFSPDRAILTGQSDGSLHIESAFQETGRLDRERQFNYTERTLKKTRRQSIEALFPSPTKELPARVWPIAKPDGLGEALSFPRNLSPYSSPAGSPNLSPLGSTHHRIPGSIPFQTSFLSNSPLKPYISPSSPGSNSDEFIEDKSCPPYRALFNNASLLIWRALEVDGVLFLNPDLDGLSDWGLAGECAPVCHVNSDPSIAERRRADRRKQSRTRSGILGYWVGSEEDGSNSSYSGLRSSQSTAFDVSKLDGDFVRTLSKSWPKGHIFAYPETSNPAATAASSNDTLPVDYQNGIPSRLTKADVLDTFRRFIPGSKSVVFVPLYDFVGKVFAVVFCWTTSKFREFKDEVEGNYLVAFGDAIMAEVSRLHTVSAEVSKGKFIASISHELRSPLHGTLASSELLAETELDNFQRGLLGTMYSCSRTLLDTINHILAFRELNPASDADRKSTAPKEIRGTTAPAGIASGLQGIVKNVDLAELIEDAVEAAYAGQRFEPPRGRHKESAKNGGVSVIIDFDPELTDSKFSVFPEALRRLVLNLCVNAFKYTSRGWVAVRLEVKEQVRARNGEKGSKSAATLTVADSGEGIGREYLKNNLFTPFVQENPTLSGMGLGMSIVRQIVGELGGTIGVQSQVGAGTEVSLDLMLDISLPLLSTTENRLALFRGRLQKKRVCIGGFDQRLAEGTSPESEALRIGYMSLRNTLTDILKMKIVETSYQSATPGEVDFAIVLNGLDLKEHIKSQHQTAGEQSHPYPGQANGVPLVVLCYQVSRGETPPKPQEVDGFVCFVSEPHGPRKLAAGLIYALDLWETRFPSISTSKSTPDVFHDCLQISSTPQPPSRQPSSQSLPTLTNGVSSAIVHDMRPIVLIVEDNIINMMLLSTFVSKRGYPFETAENGMEAYQAVQRRPEGFDVILMDLQMPVMSGIDSTVAIRILENDRGVKKTSFIVALTGLGTEGDRLAAERAGINRYMVKPVAFVILGKLLEEVCGVANGPSKTENHARERTDPDGK